jgi:hypothetical protein
VSQLPLDPAPNDLPALGKLMRELFPDANIEITQLDSSLLLTGKISSQAIAEGAAALATSKIDPK